MYNRAGARTEYTDVMLTKRLHGAGSSPACLSDVREYLPEFCLGKGLGREFIIFALNLFHLESCGI